MLGVTPALGRGLRAIEEYVDRRAAAVVVLSDRAWRDIFGADPSIVGQDDRLDGRGPGRRRDAAGLRVSVRRRSTSGSPSSGTRRSAAQVCFRRAHWLRAIARLKPGVTLAQADAQLQTVVERLKQQYPATNGSWARMMPLHDSSSATRGCRCSCCSTSVALLLLIACANVGNLLLVQAAAREREGAVRLALGAGRTRLVRQAITESLVLSLVGGACGLAARLGGHARARAACSRRSMLRVQRLRRRWHGAAVRAR